MKKIFTLAIYIVMSTSLFAQHVDYDHDSRWFFGLNVGGTWNTTDVDDKLHAGWGFIFGRQFNSNYGKLFNYDLRLRYLGGRWYGQDYDTTGLASYEPAYMPSELLAYKNAPGFTVNNFETEVHELGLELAIHANRMRERHGWDPYIFGGINLAWNRTMSDLVNFDSTVFSDGQYDYTQGINKAYINSILDDDYETAMNEGSLNDGYNLDVVPSLGFGISYWVSPRFAIGLEHKTSFALKDDWDGYEDPELRWGMFENDVYHYSGGFLRFQFRGGGRAIEAPDNPDPVNNNLTGCDKPKVRITRPSSTGTNVDQEMYNFRANVGLVAGRDHITLRVNGLQTTNFFYNTNTGDVEASLVLQNGSNTIQIEGRNGCGTVIKNVTINYANCIDPIVNFTAPSHNNLNVDAAQYVVRATIAGNATSVQFKLNGNQSSNFFYNASNGSFESTVVFQRGANTIQITATNDCGTVTETLTVNYTDCTDPEVQFLVANGTSVNESRYNVKSNVLNVVNKNNISVRVNGSNKTFSYNTSTHVVESIVVLQPGNNTIQITATNDCGTDTETITITYTPCDAPVISVLSPANASSTSSTNTTVFKAKVTNVTNVNQLQLKVNGNTITGGIFNPSTKIFQRTITLVEGTNTIQLIATNNCDTDAETVTIGYNAPCIDPAVSMILPGNGTTTSNGSVLVKAQVLNVTNVNQITLKVNGNVVTGGSYNVVTQIFQKTVTLQNGSNLIKVIAQNDCGNAAGSVTVIKEVVIETPPEETVTICHRPPGNPSNAQTLTIPLSAWPAHQAHGDVLGPCPEVEEPVEEEKIVICHRPPGNPTNTQELEIPLSAWPAHQAHGDVLGPCPADEVEEPVEEEQIVICHRPPGNPRNTQELTIPLSAWPAHQAHGDVLGPCPTDEVEEPVEEEKIVICHRPPGNPTNTQELEIPLSAWPAHQAHGDVLGPCPVEEEEPVEEEQIVICHRPPGNPRNTQELTIPLSAWPAHQAHGDVLGPCPTEEEEPVEEEQIVICHHPPGNPRNTQELTIPLSAWPAHQAHGDVLGPCPEDNGNNGNGGNNGNNGHGNNDDGVDVSNPGQGTGGPNGEDDQSGNVDDEVGGGNQDPGTNVTTEPGSGQAGTIGGSGWGGSGVSGQSGNSGSSGNSGNNGNSGSGGNSGSSGASGTGGTQDPGTSVNTEPNSGQTGTIGGSGWSGTGVSGQSGTSGSGTGGGNREGASGTSGGQNNLDAVKAAEEEAKRKAAEEAKKKAEEAAKARAEEAAKRAEAEEAKRKAEEAAKRKAAAEAKKKAEEEAQRKAAAEAKAKAEAAAKKKAEEEEAKQRAAEAAAKKKAEQEAKAKAEAAAKKKAEDAAKAKAEAAAKKKAEEDAKKKAAEDAKKKAEEEKKKELEENSNTRGGGK